MHIEVVGSGSHSQTSGAAGNTPQDNSQEVSAGKDLFVNLSVSRKDVYVGEPIVATVKLYTRVNLSGINEIKFPPFNGFLKSDIQTPPLTSLRQENVRGTMYGTGVVQQFLLYPQVTGEIESIPSRFPCLFSRKQVSRILFLAIFSVQSRQCPESPRASL